jgi:5-methylcytosine-specific restriction endonuclease McrA
MDSRAKQKEQLRRAQGNRCRRCGELLGEDAEIHAIIRGEHDHDNCRNLELLHPKCHRETDTYGKERRDLKKPFGR